jgi:MurNAc alpha-1-phosphate uridylyltransferase
MGAMILAAGRGERMRPLSDGTPKPLLEAGGKPLIAWQIEALARAGCLDIVVNVAHLAQRFVAALGDGAAFGVTLPWSVGGAPGLPGIATALPLLPPDRR